MGKLAQTILMSVRVPLVGMVESVLTTSTPTPVRVVMVFPASTVKRMSTNVSVSTVAKVPAGTVWGRILVFVIR